MQRTYLAGITLERGTFGVVFPDFPGCVTVADSLEQAIVKAHEALQFHIDTMIDDGDVLPEPKLHRLDAIKTDFYAQGDADTWLTTAAVTVEVPQPQPMARVPLGRIDALSESRSQFITRAIENEMARRKQSA